MAAIAEKKGSLVGNAALNGCVVVTAAMVVLDNPEPIKKYPKAMRRRLTNASLRTKAKTHKPPQSWFAKDEDGLY
jgi:hypothetical protein